MKWPCLFFLFGYMFIDEQVVPSAATSKRGRTVANLTSDSPALVGSNVTFTATLKFPRCQKEDNDSNIIYDQNCLKGTSTLYDVYVYNWTQWTGEGGWLNGTQSSYNVFPDGRPFPHHHDWRRRNFIYIFQTLGQYYQQTGGSLVMISLNTTNITVGEHLMQLFVYRRGFRSYVPLTNTNVTYVVTDQIPFHVNISQKSARNTSDFIFIKDIPIKFNVQLHDPSHYLNQSAISYYWNFGDGSGLFVSNSSISEHTYTLLGNFSVDLSIEAIIPISCEPATHPPPLPTFPVTTQLPSNVTPTYGSLIELPTGQAPVERCNITRYGTYKALLYIVEGILGVNIIQMTSVRMAATQVENTLVDFVVTCQGSLPTDACTIIADPTCKILQSESCHPVDVADLCLLTIREAFNESGTYCVNITLTDETSLAITSTLISIRGDEASFSKTTEGILITGSFLVVFAVLLTFFLYKRYKKYKPIERKGGEEAVSKGLNVYFNNIKAVLFPASNERYPLLKSKQLSTPSI